jgi:hypothetical protein
VPLPRVRFTVRRLMIAVAVLALLLGATAIRQRRAHFQSLADYHAVQARHIQSSHGSMIRPGGTLVHVPLGSPSRAAYHKDMAIKYEHAASRPWMTVEPDPPLPE